MVKIIILQRRMLKGQIKMVLPVKRPLRHLDLVNHMSVLTRCLNVKCGGALSVKCGKDINLQNTRNSREIKKSLQIRRQRTKVI